MARFCFGHMGLSLKQEVFPFQPIIFYCTLEIKPWNLSKQSAFIFSYLIILRNTWSKIHILSLQRKGSYRFHKPVYYEVDKMSMSFIDYWTFRMSEWMNKWMNAWINEWMNEWMNERKDDQIYKKLCRGLWNVFVMDKPTTYWPTKRVTDGKVWQL